MIQLRRVLLALLAGMISWFLLKLILVPEDPVIIQLSSDKPLTGAIYFDTVLPWERSVQKTFSPEQITSDGGSPREVSITLQPLGQAHSQGRGSEIWIYEIASDLERFDSQNWGSLPLPASWQHNEKQRAVAFIGGDRTPLTLNLRAKAKLTLRLLRHPWSGQVQITVDGVSRTVDLYAPESRWGPIREVFLLPLPLEVPQRIETALPRTTIGFRLVLTDGPRIMRINRAEWQSRGLWVWDPQHGTVDVGPGVQILEKSGEGWLLQMEQSEGWISFNDLQTKPFFWPGSWGLVVILVLVLIWWAAWEIYHPRMRIGAFLKRQAYWAKFALPCLAVWLVYWLAFFPGLMSPDSIDQWGQLLSFRFNEAHPAFHTLTNWLVTRVWLSPAAVALAQMFAMGSLVGWGLAKFARLGVPSALLWVVCGLFALSPVMGMMTITLWKDIPYAISLLWLTLLMLEIIVSRGQWLAMSKRNPLMLGVVLVFVALFRHQGVLVALGTLLVLGLVYRSFWKQILIVFVIAISIYGTVRGPVYHLLDVQGLSNFALSIIPVHQVAAVIVAGTPLTPEEQSLLDKILPIEKWRTLYHCTYSGHIIYNAEFNLKELDKHIVAFRRTWLALILRNPGAILKHQLCVGALVWLVPPLTYLHTVERGVRLNDFGLSTQSQWPAAREFIMGLVDWSERHQVIWVMWRPALYLYSILLLTLMVAFRTRKPTWLIFALPALLQSASLLLINPAQDFRYQFSIYLIGLMSICLLFLTPDLLKHERTR